ncbi:hypothetical protein MTR_8g060460 [Medicago truncatula]|uniref:Uncharacterized protein n=1 Tax=Medicago truncatula TaxID=3880 RepID=G7LCV4_MEDTR|nr:hypothetical protein MTR_8g060460 [Medicago truncatula]
MKIKTADEVRELIDNISLNEYHADTEEEEAAPKKNGMIDLNTQDALLASNKVFNIQLHTLSKRLDAREVGQLYAIVTCDLCWQAHESGACLPASFGLSEEKIKYMDTFTRKQRNLYSNTYNPDWAKTSKFLLPKQQCSPEKNVHPRSRNNNNRVNSKEWPKLRKKLRRGMRLLLRTWKCRGTTV